MLRLNPYFAILLFFPPHADAQEHRPTDIPHLVQDATRFQLASLQHRDVATQYEAHRSDSREDTVRVIVESSEGPIGRVIARNNRPLTADEDAAERNRLKEYTPADMQRKRKGEQTGQKFGTELITAIPSAMNFALTAGQPQLPQMSRPQIVLDFEPNPAFHPASTTQGLLTGLKGRLWIDAADHHLVRMELHVIHNLNLAWGLLARVYSGGTLEYDQRDIGNGHYAYTKITMDLTLRELMVKTVPYRSVLTATNYRVLSSAPSLAEAMHSLLNLSPNAVATPGR